MNEKPQIEAKQASKKLTPEEVAEQRIAEWKRDPSQRDDPAENSLAEYCGSKTRSLDLRVVGLKSVPESIRHLNELEILELGANRIQKFPAWIGELRSLKSINLFLN